MPENLFNNVIISDTSCIIGLKNIERLDLLQNLYKK